MSAAEFEEWWMDYQDNPWGESRNDLRMGILASVIANRHRDARYERHYTPEDFLPTFRNEDSAAPGPPPTARIAARQTPEDIQALLGLWASA